MSRQIAETPGATDNRCNNAWLFDSTILTLETIVKGLACSGKQEEQKVKNVWCGQEQTLGIELAQGSDQEGGT